ncbi:UNVERIFIED_CONTAM: hypothetical protein Slati_2382100 [Sesamum latifolium]|uniref:Uncharacterized protein n=1 Tax=Sesamum latifolium TaxID=2727402 RepID=A0AAW2WE40_9LAMI
MKDWVNLGTHRKFQLIRYNPNFAQDAKGPKKSPAQFLRRASVHRDLPIRMEVQQNPVTHLEVDVPAAKVRILLHPVTGTGQYLTEARMSCCCRRCASTAGMGVSSSK